MTDDPSPFEIHLSTPYRRGACPAGATHTGGAHSKICGDFVRFEFAVADGTVLQAWHTSSGCLVCQTGASLLSEFAEGRTLEELKAHSPQDHLNLFGMQLTPLRQRCALVSYTALRDAFDFDL